MVEIEVHGADEIARDLQTADRLRKEFGKVVSKGALNIKNDLRDDAKSNGHYKHFHRSISYEKTGELEAEIGPDKDKIQGALGNLLYFGRSDTAGVLDFEQPWQREVPKFQKALGDVGREVL